MNTDAILIAWEITHTLELSWNIFVWKYLEKESPTSFDNEKCFYSVYKLDRSFISINELEKAWISYKISEFKAYIPEFK